MAGGGVSWSWKYILIFTGLKWVRCNCIFELKKPGLWTQHSGHKHNKKKHYRGQGMHQHMPNHVSANHQQDGWGIRACAVCDSYDNIWSRSETLHPRMHYNHRVHWWQSMCQMTLEASELLIKIFFPFFINIVIVALAYICVICHTWLGIRPSFLFPLQLFDTVLHKVKELEFGPLE